MEKEKLKTLKDITSDWNFRDKIKAEAIKWVKEQRDLFGANATGDFWMEKLNITEEDLK